MKLTKNDMMRAAQLINAEENANDAMFGVLWTLGLAHVENNAWVLDAEEVEDLGYGEDGFTFDGYDFFETKVEAVADAMWQMAWAMNLATKASGKWERI